MSLLMWVLGSEFGPVKEQQVFSTAELSLQPLKSTELTILKLEMSNKQSGVVVHTCSFSTTEMEAGKSRVHSGQVFARYSLQCQPWSLRPWPKEDGKQEALLIHTMRQICPWVTWKLADSMTYIRTSFLTHFLVRWHSLLLNLSITSHTTIFPECHSKFIHYGCCLLSNSHELPLVIRLSLQVNYMHWGSREAIVQYLSFIPESIINFLLSFHLKPTSLHCEFTKGSYTGPSTSHHATSTSCSIRGPVLIPPWSDHHYPPCLALCSPCFCSGSSLVNFNTTRLVLGKC